MEERTQSGPTSDETVRLYNGIAQVIQNRVCTVTTISVTKIEEQREAMKKILFFIFITMFIFISSSYADGLTLFSTETSAQEHCPNDEVVWLNLPTGIWHKKGARWYGVTKHGAYVCKQKAALSGDRQSLDGS